MEIVVFELRKGRFYNHNDRVYVKRPDGTLGMRPITFSKSGVGSVTDAQRNEQSVVAPIRAQFKTSDKALIDAMYNHSGYGSVFIQKGDDEAKLKGLGYDISSQDAEKVAIRQQFEAVGIEFDGKKALPLLKAELRLAFEGLSGKKVKLSKPVAPIENNIDVAGDINQAVTDARELYKEKYGEDVPDDFKDDKSFLSALTDPTFDAEAYIARKRDKTSGLTIDELQEAYKAKFGNNVANSKKNDAEWIKGKLAE